MSAEEGELVQLQEGGAAHPSPPTPNPLCPSVVAKTSSRLLGICKNNTLCQLLCTVCTVVDEKKKNKHSAKWQIALRNAWICGVAEWALYECFFYLLLRLLFFRSLSVSFEHFKLTCTASTLFVSDGHKSVRGLCLKLFFSRAQALKKYGRSNGTANKQPSEQTVTRQILNLTCNLLYIQNADAKKKKLVYCHTGRHCLLFCGIRVISRTKTCRFLTV